MRWWQGMTLLVVAALLFLVANRGAYSGYFMDDDLDNIAWTRPTTVASMFAGILDVRYYPQNFRPVGHTAYAAMANTAGLDYRWYVALIHALHFANVVLLWWLLRRLGLPLVAAGAGTLFFVFPMAVFDALWKPMFQFDVWCALFCLLSLHAWMSRRFVLAFVAFWLAYKSKEHAVMLPVVFALYEWWLGEKRWRPLIPFFAASLSFGLQAMLLNRQRAGDYAMSLSPLALLRTTVYYGTRILLLPYLGFLLLLLPRRIPDRRLWFGLGFAALLLLPMLLLPNRLAPAYLYVPLAGVAITIAVLSSRLHWGFTIAFFVLWLPLNFQSMRDQRREALTCAHENRAYVEALSKLPAQHPGIRRFIYDARPTAMREWGIRGALRFLYRAEDIELTPVEQKNLDTVFAAGPVALLSWSPGYRRLDVVARAPGDPDAPYITMGRATPIWQLGDGWYALEGHYRWSKPAAHARLWRPAGARQFEAKILVGPQLIEAIRRTRLEVFLDSKSIGSTEFDDHGWRTVRYDLTPADPAPVKIEFRVHPQFQLSPNDRELGLAFGAFGFPEATP